MLVNTGRHKLLFMETAGFNEWDFYPLNLRPNEVNNPVPVLNEFFDDDWLPGQLDRLQQWRDVILKDEYYLDEKGSPFGLYYFYKLNIRLIEAVHLIKESGERSDIVKQLEDLAVERQTWRDYPSNLSHAELLNPYLVISSFFSAYNLPEYRVHLSDWLEYGLSSKSANEFIETADLVRVYENLQKLYSAAWLICQRLSVNLYLKETEFFADLKRIFLFTPPVNVYQLEPKIPMGQEETVSKLIGMIKHKVPSVQAIYYLGHESVSGNTFLLVLTANEEQQHAQALSSCIEESCRPFVTVVALVHHASTVSNCSVKDNLFFNRALSAPVIYLSGDFLPPVPKPLSHCKSLDDPAFNWPRWRNQGRDFLSGAEFYLEKKAYGACLFSLHQCVECLLIALVRGILGYRINNHNLSRLLNISRMFTYDLMEVFDLDGTEGALLFDLLKHAYINVRYRDTFEPDAKAIAVLYQQIKYFVAIAEKIYQIHLLNSDL